MASILDKYGIKEVADVVFYEKDSKGAPSAPVLYLDSLKVSTIEQSAEVVDATGGKGNVKLISWDTNKEITATFEDALFSAKSLAIMFGGQVKWNGTGEQEVLKTVPYDVLEEVTPSTSGSTGESTGGSTSGSTGNASKFWKVPVGKYTVYIAQSMVTYFYYDGADVKPTTVDNSVIDFVTFDLLDATTTLGGSTEAVKEGLEIKIDASTFGGTYYITGDTYARNYRSGQDEFLQFIIPKGKVSSEDLSLTMEADGDPATFSMNVNVLKDTDGTMFKLVKYTLDESLGEGGTKNKGVASVLDAYDGTGNSQENAGWYSDVDVPSSWSTSIGTIAGKTGSKPTTKKGE